MFHEGFRKANLALGFQPKREAIGEDSIPHVAPNAHVFPYDQLARIREIGEAREDAEVTAHINALEGDGK